MIWPEFLSWQAACGPEARVDKLYNVITGRDVGTRGKYSCLSNCIPQTTVGCNWLSLPIDNMHLAPKFTIVLSHGDNPRPILGIAIGPSIWDRTLWLSNPTNVRKRRDFQKIIPSMKLWSYVRLSTRSKCDQHNEWCAIPKIGNSRFQNAAY